MERDNRFFQMLVGLVVAAAAGSGCTPAETQNSGGGGSGGGDGGSGGAGGSGGGGGTWVSSTGPEHCGLINADEAWAADRNPHLVTCDIQLEGGTLRIGPGTEVLFADDTGIRVSSKGGKANLDVAGEEGAPVSFRSEKGSAPGQWVGLVVSEAAGAVSLSHLSIESAGGKNTSAALDVTAVDIHVDHLSVLDADEIGLHAHAFGGLDASSTALVISGSTGYPVQIDPERADSLPAKDSAYTGNTEDAIRIEGKLSSHKEIRAPHTWEDLGVPYLAAGSLSLNGTAAKPAVLTLLDGVTVMFEEQSGIWGGYEGAGGLVAQGTAERPVVLTSANGQNRGAWAGVKGSDNMVDADFRLEHTVIEYGGGFNTTACLQMIATSVLAKDLTLKGCDESGFDFTEEAFFQDGSTGLVVNDAGMPGQIMASQAHTIPEDGAKLADNDDPAVLLLRGHQVPIAGEVSWGDIGVPYRAKTGVTLAGTVNKPSILNLVPGITVQFGLDGFLEVGKDGAGALRAKGTAAAPIVLTGADAADPGAWGGVDIGDLAVDAETTLDNVLVEYGGGKNSLANIRITAASPTISNSRIENSDEWGIYLVSGAAPVLINNSFIGNPAGDIGP